MNNITFQSVHFKASEQLEGFVNEKVSKLFDQDESIIRADVTLFEGASGNPNNQFCEIQLSVSGENHFVKKNTDSYEKSILEAVEALQKVLRRKKTKEIGKRRKL
ncbi:MAG: HPF/RaiA family ribosome-associated protein [Chloroflexia bacterium]|nr:HPF/RaiA family ribosome-associated protein [Bacteroidales bacterium]NJO89495.1 HPF/RaiA family ribosome-associated protein [Chloroflexia bacterium]